MMRMMKKTEDRTPAGAASAGEQEQPTTPARVYAPRCDIRETEEALIVVADVPGVDRESVEITLDRGVLTLRAARAAEAHEGFQPLLIEYEPGSYERSFTLPDAIDQERVAATVANGVLTLTLPKAKSARPRRIEVHAG
jgi:HSP20 family protein